MHTHTLTPPSPALCDRAETATTLFEMGQEKEWLGKFPDSAMWDAMERRFRDINATKDSTDAENDVLKFFFASR